MRCLATALLRLALSACGQTIDPGSIKIRANFDSENELMNVLLGDDGVGVRFRFVASRF